MQSQEAVEKLYECYTKTAVNIISHYGAEERKTKLQELREVVKNSCLQDAKLKKALEIKNRLFPVYDDEETPESIECIMQEYTKVLGEFNIDASQESKLLEYDRQVEALMNDEEQNDENDDGELQLTGGYVNVIDPISKKRIVDPVKNTICGHTYDRESITQILKINKKTRCPVVGCRTTEFVTLSNLRTDIVTKTYLEKNPA